MITVFENNIVPIVVALLVGLLIGWWAFRRAAGSRKLDQSPAADGASAAPAAALAPERVDHVQEVAPAEPVRQAEPLDPRSDGGEGNSIVDQGMAAAADVAGQVLGVAAHSEMEGASGPPDNLQMLKGVGPKLAEKLQANGITRFEQLARLSDNEVAMLEDRLGPFKGRLTRDRVVEQASYLARGDSDGFEARFGKLGSGG
jgi:predicted flap endonuclease-1-like 5' DNA nuclease